MNDNEMKETRETSTDKVELDADKFWSEYTSDMDKFKYELKVLINKLSLEQYSNTPDFLIAEFLVDSLYSFNRSRMMIDFYYSESED